MRRQESSLSHRGGGREKEETSTHTLAEGSGLSDVSPDAPSPGPGRRRSLVE